IYLVGYEAPEVQHPFRGARNATGYWQTDLIKIPDASRPTLGRPGAVQTIQATVLAPKPGDKAAAHRSRIGDRPVARLVIDAEGQQCRMPTVMARQRIRILQRVSLVVRVAHVFHIPVVGVQPV